MGHYGFNGKIAHIDLTARTWWVEEPDDEFWRVYGGGGLLATYYLTTVCPAGTDAFHPDNLLILTSSVIAGHPYAGLARFTVAAKSPLTGGVGETRCEGPFGQALKASGFDALIVRGASQAPVTIAVSRGKISFADASEVWGKRVSATVDQLEDSFGEDATTAVIGPAGENRVRFASIVTARSFQASRMGIGAVMGSKRLKAVVLTDGQLPEVARPAECRAMTESYRERIADNPLTAWQFEPPGFSAWVHVHGTDTALCTRNYRDSVFEAAAAYKPDEFMRHYLGDGDCPGCPNNCIKFFSGRPGQTGRKAEVGGIHQEITGALGSNLGIADLEAVLEANILCNEFGLDPTSLGFTLSMAMECVERGILDAVDIGIPLRFGEHAALSPAIEKIANREGFGDVLAEGSKRAAARIGPAAEPYALHVKGLEMTPFEPRTQSNLALGFAVAPIGPRYDICEHDWDFDTEVGWPHAMENARTLGILSRIPMGYLGLEKVRGFKSLNTIWSAADALDMCIFAIAPTRIYTLDEMSALLSAVTGWKTSSHEIMRFGERRNQLMRAYNLREGLTTDDDTLPDRFFDDPIHEGDKAGARLDRDTFSGLIQAYYRMMGWDSAGRPFYETLVEHHLGGLVDEGHLERI